MAAAGQWCSLYLRLALCLLLQHAGQDQPSSHQQTTMTRIALISLQAASFLLVGCSLSVPATLANGRAIYNELINKTEDEQILNMMVRERYDETFGLLMVTSVTSSISTTANLGSQIGIGPTRNYSGNIVPLSLGFAYEENPTITYVPLSGELFLQRALAPMTLEHLYLMARASQDCTSVFRFMIRRLNGLANSIPGAQGPSPGYHRAASAYQLLHDRGSTAFVRAEAGGDYYIDLHDYAGLEGTIRTFFEAAGLRERPIDGEPILLPVRLGIGSDPDHLILETRSVLDLIRAIGDSIDVPSEHVEAGMVKAIDPASGRNSGLIRIRSSSSYPQNTSVATRFRDYWFYIDATDITSKRVFSLLRILIGMRLSDPGASSRAPALTIPIN